jgi:hypothetical protein
MEENGVLALRADGQSPQSSLTGLAATASMPA